MRRIIRRLSRALGRRGIILGAYGTIWALYGYGLVAAPPDDPRGLTLLLQVMPLQAWGCLWVAAGLMAIVCAWLPQGRDAPGFVALMAIALPWTLSHLISWWPLGVYPRGWVGAVIWASATVPVGVVAGWSETPPPKKVEHVDGKR